MASPNMATPAFDRRRVKVIEIPFRARDDCQLEAQCVNCGVRIVWDKRGGWEHDLGSESDGDDNWAKEC